MKGKNAVKATDKTYSMMKTQRLYVGTRRSLQGCKDSFPIRKKGVPIIANKEKDWRYAMDGYAQNMGEGMTEI